jgi:ribose 5-phosphate isomerase B
MGARVVGEGLADEIVRVWLATEFEGGRHQRRIDQITAIENSLGEPIAGETAEEGVPA